MTTYSLNLKFYDETYADYVEHYFGEFHIAKSAILALNCIDVRSIEIIDDTTAAVMYYYDKEAKCNNDKEYRDKDFIELHWDGFCESVYHLDKLF